MKKEIESEEWIVSAEELKRNRDNAIQRDKINKKNTQLRIFLLKILGIIMIILFLALIVNYLILEDNKSLEKKSRECASEGYGIKVTYTKEGDKYYICNLTEEK